MRGINATPPTLPFPTRYRYDLFNKNISHDKKNYPFLWHPFTLNSARQAEAVAALGVCWVHDSSRGGCPSDWGQQSHALDQKRFSMLMRKIHSLLKQKGRRIAMKMRMVLEWCAFWPQWIASVIIVGLFYGARNVLSFTRRIMQNFLALRDSPIIPLRRSPEISRSAPAIGETLEQLRNGRTEREKITLEGSWKFTPVSHIFNFILCIKSCI